METDDLGRLRREFSDWKITASTVTANSGPDVRSLVAKRGDDTIAAFSVKSLRLQLLQREPYVS